MGDALDVSAYHGGYDLSGTFLLPRTLLGLSFPFVKGSLPIALRNGRLSVVSKFVKDLLQLSILCSGVPVLFVELTIFPYVAWFWGRSHGCGLF